ncbi:hypothetical protein GF336_00175, partial [Candidatus Woesearchaeota archaeon]|nr:hypothetical protein [Candidatus Woesearchaeota archaeon]
MIYVPELPDVESFKRYAKKALNKKIKTVSVKQKKIINVSESTLRRHLSGNKLTRAKRHGKYLFLKISDGYYLVLHFGMTGDLAYQKKDEPEHTALEMELSNGYKFAVISIRKLGEIDIAKSIDKFIEEKELGADALSINKKELVELAEDSRGAVKNFLMDQS